MQCQIFVDSIPSKSFDVRQEYTFYIVALYTRMFSNDLERCEMLCFL